jgi:lipopolysaccharide/colanic/teichoic acid biosynthesis glycosyltransferase
MKESKRFDIRPGITGLAQVCGRNELSWEKDSNMMFIMLKIVPFY